MKINYNLKGKQRLDLVKAISKHLGIEYKYKGVPTFNYVIGCFDVNLNGSLLFDDGTDSDVVKGLTEHLSSIGYHPITDTELNRTTIDVPTKNKTTETTVEVPTENKTTETTVEMPTENKTTETTVEMPTENEGTKATVEVPMEKVNLDRLSNLIKAKGSLIKKALGVEALPIEVGSDKVGFPWLNRSASAKEVKAFTTFISALCKMSLESKRINATEKEVPNEKYAFRCFLLRLGFIGDEFKAERKILLSNLTGSSAFRNGGNENENN